MTALLDRAAMAVLAHEYELAERLFQELAASDPDGARKGLAAIAVHRDEGARAEALLASLPTDPEAQLMLGTLELERGDAASALARAMAVEGARAGLASTELLRGRALRALGRLHEAEKALARAVERAPESYEAHLEHADVLLAAGDLVGATHECFAAAEREPGLAAAYVRIARILVRARAAAKAVDIVEGAIRLVGSEPELLEALAEASLVAGDVPRALTALDELAEAVAETPDGETRLAELYGGANDHELAKQHIDVALRVAPEHPRAHFIAGLLAAGRNDRAAAVEEYRRALALGVREAAVNLAAVLAEDPDADAGALAEAERLLDGVRDLDAVQPAAMLNRALVAIRRERVQEARKLLRPLVETNAGGLGEQASAMLRRLDEMS